MIAPLFDDLIGEVDSLCARAEQIPFAPWPDAGRGNLVLPSEMAFELGAHNLPAVALFAATSTDAVAQADTLWLLGRDLNGLNSGPWARVALLRLSEDAWENETDLYNTLTRVRYTRYRVNPEGFMPRIDSRLDREPVRVGRTALKAGLCFAGVGERYRTAYRSDPAVLGVRQIFITDPTFDYAALDAVAKRCGQVLTALDHILQDFRMDCSHCGLQAVCNEVEGLRALHFAH